LFQSLAAPAILMGDLNSRPDDPQLQSLLSEDEVDSVLTRLGDAAPTDNIDWIITRGLECVDATYHHSGASDHPVIQATLR
jgi:endonuclease/exonuclease/phosphatase (EEP) superfamily protein YafD